MTVVITYLADDNARNRRRARRQAQREQAMKEQRLARKIALKLSGCVRADKAISLGSLCCKKKEEAVRKNRSIYYKDSNPLGNKIHAVQKIKLYSKLPYGAY
ncbi:regulator [Escherichia coli]|uniref:regulator n=1 Tax=Enterobacteriaceae TaxID=543 RepID=UPI000DD6932B|nr:MULTISPECIES: regulator [Enterobacteriaceae]ULK08190.1 regulator [Shigella dysenteriae]ULK12931.1 regulator [Shigella dysenteriae]